MVSSSVLTKHNYTWTRQKWGQFLIMGAFGLFFRFLLHFSWFRTWRGREALKSSSSSPVTSWTHQSVIVVLCPPVMSSLDSWGNSNNWNYFKSIFKPIKRHTIPFLCFPLLLIDVNQSIHWVTCCCYCSCPSSSIVSNPLAEPLRVFDGSTSHLMLLLLRLSSCVTSIVLRNVTEIHRILINISLSL